MKSKDIKLALCQMIGQSATGQGHEIFNLTEKELVYKQKVVVDHVMIPLRHYERSFDFI